MHPESNADAMVYEIARLLTAGEPRITWAPNSTEGERHWYAIDQVGAKRHVVSRRPDPRPRRLSLVRHRKEGAGLGHQLRPPVEQRALDYALYGHFHTPNRMFLSGITAWCNGSTESHNPYALEQLAAAARPHSGSCSATPSGASRPSIWSARRRAEARDAGRLMARPGRLPQRIALPFGYVVAVKLVTRAEMASRRRGL